MKKSRELTEDSCRHWILRHGVLLSRFLRQNFEKYDWQAVYVEIMRYPIEGKKLLLNFSLDNESKLKIFCEWFNKQYAITACGEGDQRSGKDASLCALFEILMDYRRDNDMSLPRVVTVGNTRIPPFVKDEDMYFSFRDIPVGSFESPVWLYCGEIETVLPSRETKGHENTLYSQIAGTFAQNGQYMFGLTKNAYKVDINFFRDCNLKFFKYLSPSKLEIENLERGGFLSSLAKWMLPKDEHDKAETLLIFDEYMLMVRLDLPKWWNREYSEMFKNVELCKIQRYVDVLLDVGMKPNQIVIAVYQKFRRVLERSVVEKYSTGEISELKTASESL